MKQLRPLIVVILLLLAAIAAYLLRPRTGLETSGRPSPRPDFAARTEAVSVDRKSTRLNSSHG